MVTKRMEEIMYTETIQDVLKDFLLLLYSTWRGFRNIPPATPSKRSKGKKNRKVTLNSNPKSVPLSLGLLDELLKARRFVIDPPRVGHNLILGDFLWSDPSMKPGLSPNKERGIGFLWGPDYTQEFLQKNNLKVIL